MKSKYITIKDMFEIANNWNFISLYSVNFDINGYKAYTGKLTEYEKKIPVTSQKEGEFLIIKVGLLTNKSR